MVSIRAESVRLHLTWSIRSGMTPEPILLVSPRPAIGCSDDRIRFCATFNPDGLFSRDRGFLKGLFRRAGMKPRHLVSDQGSQFTAREFKRWCRRRGIRQQFGAIGKYGSLAVIERCIRSIKNECTRRLILVPYCLAAMEQELAFYFSWYNGHRPLSRLGGATPNEVY